MQTQPISRLVSHQHLPFKALQKLMVGPVGFKEKDVSANCAHRWLYLEVDGSELDGLSFGMVEGGVEGVGADGGVEDGGLLTGRGGLVWSRFGQNGDRVL